jgi:hypothetical protein
MSRESHNKVTGSKLTLGESFSDLTVFEHFLFIFYCFLLCVPAYAIIISVIDQNWLMVIIDILLVPIGFVHGLCIIFGIV